MDLGENNQSQRNHMKRTNAINTGKELEKTLAAVHRDLRHRGQADLEKVDPPVKVIGGGSFRKVTFQKNPFLDYIGTLACGRMIQLEAKSTAKLTLPCGGKAGVTETQISAMRRWNAAGALTGVVWYSFEAQEARVLTIADIDMTLEHRKSVTWEIAHPLTEPWDYIGKLKELEENLKGAKSALDPEQ